MIILIINDADNLVIQIKRQHIEIQKYLLVYFSEEKDIILGRYFFINFLISAKQRLHLPEKTLLQI